MLSFRPTYGVFLFVGHGQNHFIGMNFAVRKEAFRKSAGFNTNLKYGEDIDLAKKMKKYGRIAYIKKMRVLTHSRRYQLNLAFAKYVVNFIKTDITGKPFRNELPKIEGKKEEKIRKNETHSDAR